MKLLVACDGSQPAMRAVGFALDLIRRIPGEPGSVVLVNVHDDTALRHARSVVGKSVVDDYLRQQSEAELSAARAAIDAAGVPLVVDVRVGRISEQVVQSAKDHGCELLVLGAKGRGAVVDALLGSVAQRVLFSASAPVVLVK